MRKLKVLVVEDDPLARELVKGELQEHEVDFAADLASGRKKIGARRNDICFIDLKTAAAQLRGESTEGELKLVRDGRRK